MTKEELNEKYVILESRKNVLEMEAAELRKELEALKNGKDVSKLKKETMKREVEIRRRLDEIDEALNEIGYEFDALDEEAYKIEDAEKTQKRSGARNAVATVLTLLLAAGLGIAAGRATKSCANTNTVAVVEKQKDDEEEKQINTAIPEENVVVFVEPTPEVTATPVPTVEPTVVPTAEPTVEPTPTPFVFDVTNDADVEEAADRVFEEDILPIMVEEDDPVFYDSFTTEDVEDIIRVANGQLPKHTEYDEYTVKEIRNKMNDLLANRGTGNKLYPVHFSHLYPEGSQEAKYIETYDEIYNNIAKYRAEGNVDGVLEQVGFLGRKLYNEWHLAGLYGGYNPYLFPYEEQYFLLQASISRFPNFVREYLEANDLTVCIPTCYDTEVEDYRLVEIRDIFEAISMGTSKNGEISVWRNGEVINIISETRAYMEDFLYNKSQEKVKKLG